jgi:hypothetical protein
MSALARRRAVILLDRSDELTVSERVLLFCVASGTDWERAGITGSMVTAMIVRGLIQRGPDGQLSLTKRGRAVLEELIGDR